MEPLGLVLLKDKTHFPCFAWQRVNDIAQIAGKHDQFRIYRYPWMIKVAIKYVIVSTGADTYRPSRYPSKTKKSSWNLLIKRLPCGR